LRRRISDDVDAEIASLHTREAATTLKAERRRVADELKMSWIGGPERDRTADLLVANEALSQLSYRPFVLLVVARARGVCRDATTLMSVAGSRWWLNAVGPSA
jgi:hypothetical protein